MGAQHFKTSVCNESQSHMKSKGIPSNTSTKSRRRLAGTEASTASGQAAGCAGSHVLWVHQLKMSM